jgi:N-acylglucosamine 2-epimerase
MSGARLAPAATRSGRRHLAGATDARFHAGLKEEAVAFGEDQAPVLGRFRAAALGAEVSAERPAMNPVTLPSATTLRSVYRDGLLGDVIPFWLRCGLDPQHGGILTALGEDGSVVDTDKSIWMQGRAAWTFATLYRTIERRPEWLAASKHCLDFLAAHGSGPGGKLYFSVTRDGRPLRMRRYVFSESFAAIGHAAYAAAAGSDSAATAAVRFFDTYLRHSFTPGVMPPKIDPAVRPSRGLAERMIAIATAQELRATLGDVAVRGTMCTEWVDRCIDEIERDFFKAELGALLEVVDLRGNIIDHFDGRTLNPGHALECAWFILREAKERGGDCRLLRLGLAILDGMWARGWDPEFGGMLYFTDLRGLPVQEYWAEMKFWWPHNEAIIATLLAWSLTAEPKYARWHARVHEWAYRVFADPVHGEWFGYAHRDGRISSRLKGSLWKGPFHLPRMQWFCSELLTGCVAS